MIDQATERRGGHRLRWKPGRSIDETRWVCDLCGRAYAAPFCAEAEPCPGRADKGIDAGGLRGRMGPDAMNTSAARGRQREGVDRCESLNA